MWIDYKKAYDSITHSWLTEILDLYKIDDQTRFFITYLMKNWHTKIHLPHDAGCISIEEIFFLRGIFQGDSLSPLLFCLALTPISNILKRNNVGYMIQRRKVSHLLYMDDLKIFARGIAEMERCRALIQEFSDDIKMTFGLDKCAVIHMKKGKIVHSPSVQAIPLLTKDGDYRYLGILQSDNILHDQTKQIAKKEFL